VRGATGDPKRAAEVELRLLTALQSDASVEAKQFVCRQLRLVGPRLRYPSWDVCSPTPNSRTWRATPSSPCRRPRPAARYGWRFRLRAASCWWAWSIRWVNAASRPACRLASALECRTLRWFRRSWRRWARSGRGRVGRSARGYKHYDPTLAEGVLRTVDLQKRSSGAWM